MAEIQLGGAFMLSRKIKSQIQLESAVYNINQRLGF